MSMQRFSHYFIHFVIPTLRIVPTVILMLVVGQFLPRFGMAPAKAAESALLQGASSMVAAPAKLLQFTSAGHVLGFDLGGMVATTGRRALRVEFVEANAVRPQAGEDLSILAAAAPTFTSVTYSNLWNGVTLTYDATGIVRSTYHLEPYANHGTIHLRYNRPVRMQDDGSLLIEFENGMLTETAPIAWQEIDGQRTLVDVTFKVLSENEVGFAIGAYNPAYSLFIDPTLTWNTFLGGASSDYGTNIAVDSAGSVYVIGLSGRSWGTPINPYTGDGTRYDAFVAKLNSSGSLVWNTFMGSSFGDEGNDIAVDSGGNVYVVGRSEESWGTPIHPWTPVASDAFVAKLDNNGVRLWHTFMGSSQDDIGTGIALDSSGKVYVAGYSYDNWGTPINPYMGGSEDTFAARLDANGALEWNTFLGGASSRDYGNGIAVDSGGNVYVVGRSSDSWGTSIHPFTGISDTYAAKLDNNGALEWNTFMGGASSDDNGMGIAADSFGNVYVTGKSNGNWGVPVNPYAGGDDIFVARLDANGALLWNTFMGSSFGGDFPYGIAVDSVGNVYVTGYGTNNWGTPISPHTAGTNLDALAAQLNSSGGLVWNTFMGGASFDFGTGIAVESDGTVYVTGHTNSGWGLPVRAHGAFEDAFAARIGDDFVSPTVMINQAPGQADPTSSGPIKFEVVFSEPVTDFTNADMDLGASTASGSLTATITGGTTIYNVVISGMTGPGTVIASIPANVATDAVGNGNTASTSTDNTVTFTPPPTCNGQIATIYVNTQGIIVGGPNNGQVYKGKLNGTAAADVIVGANGKDQIDAMGGDDVVCGRDGNDVLMAAGGNDQLFGDEGNDNLKGENGDDTLSGGLGADKFIGGTGTDTATDFTPGQGDTKSGVEIF